MRVFVSCMHSPAFNHMHATNTSISISVSRADKNSTTMYNLTIHVCTCSCYKATKIGLPLTSHHNGPVPIC